MKIWCLILSSVILLSSCSSRKFRDRRGMQKVSLPEWISDTSTTCEDLREICVVGEGKNKLDAEANASASLANIFETKVSSDIKGFSSASQSTGEGQVILSGEVQEEIEQTVRQVTENIIIKGVRFTKRFDDSRDGIVYILASLHRRKTARILRSEIELLDEKLQALYKLKKPSLFNKLSQIYNTRETLNQRYQILTDKRVGKAITYDQLVELKNPKSYADLKIFIKIKGKKDASLAPVNRLVMRSFLENFYTVIPDVKKGQADLQIQGKFEAQKLHFNVKDFVKYKFSLDLFSENQKGQKVGALSLENTHIGRDYSQAFNKSLSDFERLLIKEGKITELELKK